MQRDSHSAPLPKIGDRVQEYTWRESGEVRGIVDDEVYIVRYWRRRYKCWEYVVFYSYQWTDSEFQQWGPAGWNKQRIAWLKKVGRYFG